MSDQWGWGNRLNVHDEPVDLSTVTDRYDVGTVHDDGTAYPYSLDCEYPMTTLPVVVCKRCGDVVSRHHIPEHDAFHNEAVTPDV